MANGGIAWAPDVTKIALAAYAAPVPPACREKFEHWCLDNSGLSNWGAIGIIIGGSVFVILALVLYIALCSCACCLKHEVEAAKKSQVSALPNADTFWLEHASSGSVPRHQGQSQYTVRLQSSCICDEPNITNPIYLLRALTGSAS